ncbi:unnamed protein product [Gongylonema pulchrum]|uniref:Helicase C-terminal domain-containing protein n=1 Tax=Gongylonema pulchrum TaxID=637853 RepID=A0A183E3X1_9BILA|nr:unnamed protein product [Gongylonema pulchrum]
MTAKMRQVFEEVSNMPEKSAMLLFTNRKCDVDTIERLLLEKSIPCAAMHGGRDQIQREEALSALWKGQIKVLVATDVASRGIDLPNITHVFNFDFPTTLEMYVHRVGRTGRAGKSGKSITLLTKQEDYRAPALISMLEKNSQDVPEVSLLTNID